MKAAVLKENGILKVEEVPLPEIRGWYKIRVAFAGICGSDLGRGFKNGAYHYPLIMGHEFSGVVESVADKKNINVVGKKVGVFPLIPCGKCEFCQQKKI